MHHFRPIFSFLKKNVEKQEIAIKEAQIEQIKEGAKTLLEELLIEIKSNVDADGYIELSKYSEIMQEFAGKWTQFMEDNVYNNHDSEIVQRAMLETTKIYNECFEDIEKIGKTMIRW